MAANIVGIPDDLFTNFKLDFRRFKVSSEPDIASGINRGDIYSLSTVKMVQVASSLAVNFAFASDVYVTRISVNDGLGFVVYDRYATGTASDILSSVNFNLCSDDISPSNAQVFTSSTPVGSVLTGGNSFIEPYIKACSGSELSVIVKNNTLSAVEAIVILTFKEIGPRASSFGLTSSTQITQFTEMSDYG